MTRRAAGFLFYGGLACFAASSVYRENLGKHGSIRPDASHALIHRLTYSRGAYTAYIAENDYQRYSTIAMTGVGMLVFGFLLILKAEAETLD